MGSIRRSGSSPSLMTCWALPAVAVLVLLCAGTGIATRPLRGRELSSGRSADTLPELPAYDGKTGVIINQPPPSPYVPDPCSEALDALMHSTLGDLVDGSFFENGSLQNMSLPKIPPSLRNVTLLPPNAAVQLNSTIQGSLMGMLLNCSGNCSLTWEDVLVAALGPECGSSMSSGSTEDRTGGDTGPTEGDDCVLDSGLPGVYGPRGDCIRPVSPGDNTLASCPGCSVAEWDALCADMPADPGCQPVEIMCQCSTGCGQLGGSGATAPMNAPAYVGCPPGWVKV
eukprot:CAMPEP_0202859298 /NCGR_PEP_ID=MMETSP1391-20130828/1474_1 /ASSEMBLY_ACC=CAM_ASM_000867 /TAXON_ID=1034604 /ORGANISM="Chlamydomonas leiostraca, Strain SAG 11-49" /LENGTH=283 /DNA_ID=CAMNT_0049538321 /DNA_START=77 /DNA_END=928 /DNA_ORIENTATION=-